MGKTLILIDGHALAFREYYALERSQMSTSDGTPTWAVYGFFKAIFDLLKNRKLKADAIAVAFDVSHVTFRTEKYAEYKSNREAMPDTMRLQMDLIYEGLRAFNIPIYTKEGFDNNRKAVMDFPDDYQIIGVRYQLSVLKDRIRDYKLRHLKLGKVKNLDKKKFNEFKIVNISWDVHWQMDLYLYEERLLHR